MVQRYVVHKSEMHRVGEDESGTAEWDLVVIYEDYASLKKDRDYWYTRCLDAGLLDEDAEMDAAKRAGVFDE